MEIMTEETSPATGRVSMETPAPHTTDPLWRAAGILYRRRKFVAGVTLIACVLSIVIALLIPKWYAAEARVLQPEGGGLSILGMVDSVTGGLGSILGGAGGEYTRYLAFLTSRSMMEEVVDEFDLVEVYDLEEEEHARIYAAQALRDNVEFEVSLDYNYLSVRAYDQTPERAAAMANFMVEALNREYAQMNAQNARITRVFIENRLKQAQADLDSIRSEMQQFQETSGVIELEAQAEAFMSSVAELRAGVARAEIQYQTLAQQYGPDNPQVQAARNALEAARNQVRGALGGHDALMPLSMQELPAASRRYAELLQGQLIQAQVLETIYPLYEQSLFQEKRDAVAVQVLDEAVPPIEAARPSRRLIVIAATLSAFLIACVFVLSQTWLRRNYASIARRLDRAA